MSTEEHNLILPAALIGKHDVLALLREMNLLEEQVTQSKLRHKSADWGPSTLLQTLFSTNGIELGDDAGRQRVRTALEHLRESAPLVHLSFASEPNREVMMKVTTWLRAEVHPLVLVQVGLQPSIGAGCVLRTPNKYFDFSLRQHLLGSKANLTKLLQR